MGKSTLFNALTRSRKAEAANYPFCTIEPNVGVVEVPDDRLAPLAKIAKTNVIIPAAVEFVDIAGLVAGASKGEGLGNKFLANIREVDAIVHVVRCFDDDDILHSMGSVDPVRDIDVITTELVLADLQSCEKQLESNARKAKGMDKDAIKNVEMLKRAIEHLNANKPVSTLECSDEEREQGVLLVDFGAGTTEFVVEYNSGVQASGVLQVGFDHVCNDLSLGLDLHIDVCRKMIEDKTLQNAMRERREYMEFPSSTGRVRRIPLSSFETIIDARIRETFEIIRSMATAQGAPAVLDAGGVLTGGGALFDRTAPIFREVFDMSCRIGQPFEAGGALTGLDTPRCSTIWGALKIAAFYNELYAGQGGRGMFGNLIDVVDGVLNRTRLGWLNFKGARRG